MGVTCPEVGVVDPEVVAELLTLVEEAESLLMWRRRGLRGFRSSRFLDGVSHTEMLFLLRERPGLSPYMARSLATGKRVLSGVRTSKPRPGLIVTGVESMQSRMFRLQLVHNKPLFGA